ncbi:PIN-like domain-containing protein [Burkholderia sp. S-53]|uniref:PIN-like domain-containing protein n=1 Tax=Burkholderia sp. S-53 TaxID=2906514 RepID=UPI0021D2E198|nr:PIN-like domain-containing protein [Burkholderia sp. S-53]UXU90973.1 PIN-like domain-containing protein [Burkholderia sp. S-53]
MRDRFKSFYPLSNEERASLWKNGIFVFDASALLTLTALAKEPQQDALGTLKKLKGRMWLPHQAALEYQANRARRVAGTLKDVNEWQSKLDVLLGPLKEHLRQARSFERGSQVEVDKLLQDLDADSSAINLKLKDLKDFIGSDESVFDSIDDLFVDALGDAPMNSDDLARLTADGDARFRDKIPPGFADRTKERDEEPRRTIDGVTYDRKYGDLILWRQLLDVVSQKDSEFKKVIFITDDNKEDWWRIDSGRRQGPRRELREEITRSGAELFWMYTFSGFLENASTQLHVDVEESTIAATRQVAERIRLKRRKGRNYYYSVEFEKSGERAKALLEKLTNMFYSARAVISRASDEGLLDDGLVRELNEMTVEKYQIDLKKPIMNEMIKMRSALDETTMEKYEIYDRPRTIDDLNEISADFSDLIQRSYSSTKEDDESDV